MGHSCLSLACEDNHQEQHDCDCTCDLCHMFHIEDGIEHWWKLCNRCESIVNSSIDSGLRCVHGQFVPDGYNTDLPCLECEAAYGGLNGKQ